MGPVQEGLRTLGEGSIQFSKYLEARCRNLHHMIDVYMARDSQAEPVPGPR
jgi:hypothetical protein